MKAKLSLPELRRLSELLVDSVVRGERDDIALRDKLLHYVANETNRNAASHGLRAARDAQDAETVRRTKVRVMP